MKKASSMLFMVLLVGILIVVDIMVFVAFGPAHVVPWMLFAVTIVIPVFLSRREAHPPSYPQNALGRRGGVNGYGI